MRRLEADVIDERLERIERKVDVLEKTVVERFARVDELFLRTDQRIERGFAGLRAMIDACVETQKAIYALSRRLLDGRGHRRG